MMFGVRVCLRVEDQAVRAFNKQHAEVRELLTERQS